MSAKHLDGARSKVAAAAGEIDKVKAALTKNEAALSADRAALDQAKASLRDAESRHVQALAQQHIESGPGTDKQESEARRHLDGATKEVAKIEAAIAERQKIAEALQAALAVASEAQREVAGLAKQQAADELVAEIHRAWNKHVRPLLAELSALNMAAPGGKDAEPGLLLVDNAARQFEGRILGGELSGIDGGFLAADREALIGPPPKPRVFPPIPEPEAPKIRRGSKVALRWN